MAICGVCLAGGARFAHAQVGTGWTEIHPASNIQVEAHEQIKEFPGDSRHATDGGGAYANTGGGEIFQLVNRTSNREERRFHDDYHHGTRQFQADVTIFGPTNEESIHQIFNGSEGPWLIVRQSDDGGGSVRIQTHGASAHVGFIPIGPYGTRFRLNSIEQHQ